MKPMDILDKQELATFQNVQSILVAGHPYLLLGGFGWGWVAYYIKHTAPNRILVAHCSHFRNAGKDYGRLATEGAGSECEWRYEGELSEINTSHIIKITPYTGKVYRG